MKISIDGLDFEGTVDELEALLVLLDTSPEDVDDYCGDELCDCYNDEEDSLCSDCLDDEEDYDEQDNLCDCWESDCELRTESTPLSSTTTTTWNPHLPIYVPSTWTFNGDNVATSSLCYQHYYVYDKDTGKFECADCNSIME